MKKELFKKTSIFRFAFLSFAFALTVSSVSCSAASKLPAIEPNYLLSGDFAFTNDIFDYYELSDGTYAVALSSEYKDSTLEKITIPSVYKVDPTDEEDEGTPVTGIWHNAFYNNPTTTYEFESPSHIKTIDFEAFLSSGVTDITIPYTVNQIGDAAFYSCVDLTNVTFINSSQQSTGSGVTCYCDADGKPIGNPTPGAQYETSSLTKIPSFCFFKCTSLKTLTLPSKIEEICEEAFNGCYELYSPIYFQHIKKIRSRAFQGCVALRKVYISESLFTDSVGIEPHAFNYCSTAAAPDNLDIVFCGNASTINTWKINHPNWGWYNDRNTPAGNCYTARTETGNNFFTADWDYTYDSITGDVTILKYNGPTPSAATGWFISVPDKLSSIDGDNQVVRISRDAFNKETRQAIRRLYLPKTLVAIENNMFNIWNGTGAHVNEVGSTQLDYNEANGYKDLCVVDVNTKCVTDKALFDANQEAQIEKRIDLSALTKLEFIGFRAFSGIGGRTSNSTITRLHLPYNLRSVGDEAFGLYKQYMLPGIIDFTWDYDNSSRLETIGADAFYALGQTGNESTEIASNGKWRAHSTSTLIFPKTFRYFANTTTDKANYNNPSYAEHAFDFSEYSSPRNMRPAHAFIGCSLISKVIFKGGAEAETEDLIIPLQTFVYTESLRTIVFEERENHEITFHTQQNTNNWAQESIGGNSGRAKNDFRGEPFLQTLVLPNKTTTLRFQNFCFHANSRAAIYLSSKYGDNMYHDNKNLAAWTDGIGRNFESKPLTNAVQWKTIGDESRFDSKASQKYYGYVFGTTNTGNYSSDKSIGTYSLDQQIPVYEYVHYKETIDIKNTPSNLTDDLTVEVGDEDSVFEYVEDSFCSFVCGKVGEKYVATMTNYLYSLYDKNDSDYYKIVNNAVNQKQTAHVPETVTFNNQAYTVTKIGDSAFSACFCDGQDLSTPATVGSFDDLKYIELPNSIVSIGDYAFIRAYGVEKISSYSGSGTPTEGMPSSLQHIGKNAFTFSGIKQVLKIPYKCRFFENDIAYPTGEITIDQNTKTGVIKDDRDNPIITKPGDKITSTFSAANDLRKITFLDANSNPSTESKYYETSTYTSTSTGGPTYTCALYSKDDSDLSFNKDRLLLVLNRDNEDAKQPSATITDCTTVSRGNPSAVVGLRFNGKQKTNTFLYGAFKMGYWILDLTVGNPTIKSGTTPYEQPLISGVGYRNANNTTLKTLYIYLGEIQTKVGNSNIKYHYYDTKCDLDTISGNVLNLPQYAMNGCEKLTNVELPIQQDGVLPEGVFAGVTGPSATYYVAGDSITAHTLDLTNSKYKEIGANVFKDNTSIYYFTAPIVSDFTVGSSAFGSCTGLQTVNFSKVTTNLTLDSSAFSGCSNLNSVNFGSISGTLSIGSSAFSGCSNLNTINFGNVAGSVVINESAFNSCGNGSITLNFANVTGSLTIYKEAFKSSKVTSITWPSSNTCQVKLNSYGSFWDCDSLTSVTIPSNLSGNLGDATFAHCDGLTTVTLPSIMTANIGASAFYHCDVLANVVIDPSSSTVGVTTIGASAFEKCVALTNIDLTKFTSLTTIGDRAFYDASTLMNSGDVELPSSVTTIGEAAFSTSDIVTITITSNSISFGVDAFASCSSLEAVIFTNHNCTWTSYNDGVFKNCPSLDELQLPTGFSIVNSGYNGNTEFLIYGDSGIHLCTYEKFVAGETLTSEGWRKYDSQNMLDAYFFVESISDLVTAGVIVNSPTPGVTASASTVQFWTVDANGRAVYLGTVTSYDGSTATFSSGQTLSV